MSPFFLSKGKVDDEKGNPAIRKDRIGTGRDGKKIRMIDKIGPKEKRGQYDLE